MSAEEKRLSQPNLTADEDSLKIVQTTKPAQTNILNLNAIHCQRNCDSG